jgi:hypothetical protein
VTDADLFASFERASRSCCRRWAQLVDWGGLPRTPRMPTRQAVSEHSDESCSFAGRPLSGKESRSLRSMAIGARPYIVQRRDGSDFICECNTPADLMIGMNLQVEQRVAGELANLPRYATELVALRPDVLIGPDRPRPKLSRQPRATFRLWPDDPSFAARARGRGHRIRPKDLEWKDATPNIAVVIGTRPTSRNVRCLVAFGGSTRPSTRPARERAFN